MVTKKNLANSVSTFSICSKPAVTNGLKQLRNPPSWQVTFLLAPFNKIPLFSKDFITFIISFISVFVRAIPEPEIDEIPFLIFLPSRLSPASTRMSLFIFLAPRFFYSFAIEFSNESNPLNCALGRSYILDEPNILGGPNRNPPDCTISDKWVFVI